jgi:choline dehydrogenase-like flavoprotein
MPANNHYDVIIIGTGAGGGTLASRLAPTGKKILLLERGNYVRREKENWSSAAVNLEARYNTKEVVEGPSRRRKWMARPGNIWRPYSGCA